MGRVRLEVTPWLGETLGMAKTSEEPIPGQGSDVADSSVKSLLSQLSGRYQWFDEIVFDTKTQRLTGKVVLFLNGRDLELSEGLETRLNDGDVLTFVPLIVGG